MFSEERRDLPRIDRFPWKFSRRVMTARQPDHVEIDSEAFHFGDQLARKIDWKSQIVTRGDETHRTRFHLQQPRNEGNGTEWFPELAQLIDCQVGFDSQPHVLGRY